MWVGGKMLMSVGRWVTSEHLEADAGTLFFFDPTFSIQNLWVNFFTPWVALFLRLPCTVSIMNNLRSFVTLALLLCAAVPLARALRGPPSVYISITNTGESDLGVFFVGNETERHPPAPPDGGITVAPKADSEVLIGMIQPGEHVQQGTHFDHAFVVRTADMAFRAKIIVNPGEVARTPRPRRSDATPRMARRAAESGTATWSRAGRTASAPRRCPRAPARGDRPPPCPPRRCLRTKED